MFIKQPKEIATLGVDDGGFTWTRPESEVSIFSVFTLHFKNLFNLSTEHKHPL